MTLKPHEPGRPASRRRALLVCLSMAVAAVVYFGLPRSINELARRAAAIFAAAAVLWATEALPLYATSLCALGLQVLLLADSGGLARMLPSLSEYPDSAASGSAISLDYGLFFEPFASPVIILFLGGFLLSRAISKHGLDHAIASRLLGPVSGRPLCLVLAVIGISGFLSMWMSNTATAAMMVGVIGPLVRRLPPSEPFARALVLAVAFGANLGGMGTPIGTPPNAIALAALRLAGHPVGFVDWVLVAAPLVVLLLVVTGFLLSIFYRPSQPLPLMWDEPTAAVSWHARWTAAIALLAIGLWLSSALHGLAPAAVALLAAAALTAVGALDRRDVDSIDWNILILMWGGLSLGSSLQHTGLVTHLLDLPLRDLPAPLAAGGIVVLASGLGIVMSNTATAALVIPIAMAVSPGREPEMALLVAFACSCTMVMPISTPPNAIAYSTGRIPAPSMIGVGGIVTLLALLALLAGYRVMLPLMLP